MNKKYIISLLLGLGLITNLIAGEMEYKPQIKASGEVVLERIEEQGIYKISVYIPQKKLVDYKNDLENDLSDLMAKVASLQKEIDSVNAAIALITVNIP